MLVLPPEGRQTPHVPAGGYMRNVMYHDWS
jgi:hypothetical protein